jgi:cytochrome P450
MQEHATSRPTRSDSQASALDVDLSDPATFVAGVPHDAFRWLREHDPVHWQEETGASGSPKGHGYWALTRHADIAYVSKHSELFSSEVGSAVMSELPPRDLQNMRQQLINMDPPTHTDLRKLMNPHFKPGAVRGTEEHTRRIVRETLGALGGAPECDFVEDISAPISLRALTHFLGVPDKHSRKFYRWTNKLIGASDPSISSEFRGRLAVLEIFLYAARARRKRRRQPTHDIYSSLIHGLVEGAPLDRLQLGMNYFLLIIAGNETTRNALSGGVQALCEHPDEFGRLRREPSLLPRAIEEMLRFSTPVMQFRRTATRDTRVGEREIAKGDKLVLYYGAANRDPAVFEDPERFDITRSSNPHLAFGTGAHFCMGSHMARLEMRIALEELIERFPKLALRAPPVRLQSNFINGIKSMPVSLT